MNRFSLTLLLMSITWWGCTETDTESSPSTETESGDTATETVQMDSGTGTAAETATDSQSELESSDTGTGIASPQTLLSFGSSPCKNHMKKAVPSDLFTVSESDRYNGLQCVSWSKTEGELAVDLINFHGGCGAEYSGSALVEDNAITLQLNNPSCLEANCGYCIYDWSFTVATDASGQTPVKVQLDSCPDDGYAPELLYETVIDVATTPTGIHCEYTTGLNENLNVCGGLHQGCFIAPETPAADATADFCPERETACDAGLQCVSVSEYPSGRCLADCEGDTDCPLPEITTCQQGHCLLR